MSAPSPEGEFTDGESRSGIIDAAFSTIQAMPSSRSDRSQREVAARIIRLYVSCCSKSACVCGEMDWTVGHRQGKAHHALVSRTLVSPNEVWLRRIGFA